MDSPEPSPSNAPEWSVSDLSQALKRTVEDAYGYVKVRGEISGYRGPHSSGHAYFALKDEGARIDAIIWKANFARLKFKPEEGMEIIAHGRLTTFPGKSSYQIVIERLEPAGVGALMLMLEERRKKLAAEGLFAEDRKRALPYLPRVIGVITSPTGSVIRDILHRLADRFPRHVLVWPVRVQGETSAAEVAAAIAGFSALAESDAIARPDVLIVARGGGSLEDLWSFNEESVVRAAAASTLPLVSAIGHETDWTLIDYVADRRAPTPTGAAEMVVPVRADLLLTLGDTSQRLHAAALRLLERRRVDFRNLSRGLPAADRLFQGQRQKLDLLTARLATQSPAIALARRRERLDSLSVRLAAPLLQRRVDAAQERFDSATERLDRAFRAVVLSCRERLDKSARLLNVVSYQGILRRGFALVLSKDDKPIRDSKTAKAEQRMTLRFADGTIDVTTTDSASPAKPQKATRNPPNQGTLF